MPGTKHRRGPVTIGNPTCLLGFSGRESVDSAVFDSSTLEPGGDDAVQRVTISGSPTGGTFKLGFQGQTTAAIAFNATGATVQTALRALTRIGPKGVSVSGSAGGPHTLTFGGKLGSQELPLVTVAANNLTGGTSPTASVQTTTKGSSLFAGLFVLQSGLPLMATSDGKKVQPWDYSDPAALVGIFDGQRELFGDDDDPVIPVYNQNAVFDIAVVKGYAANVAKFETWAAGSGGCSFKSQGEVS